MTTKSNHTRVPRSSVGSIRRPLVVAVDGSVHGEPAITWAAGEAQRSGRRLVVLTVTDKVLKKTPPFPDESSESFDLIGHASSVVESIATRLRTSHRGLDVTGEIRVDDIMRGLLSEAERAEMVVVGKRGLGAFKRIMVGSTSIALAGRSPVPTIVVPDGWAPDTHSAKSILVGIDPQHSNEHALAFAFARAHDLALPLVAMHVWNTHPAVVPGPEELEKWGHQAQELVESQLTPWREKFPDVDVIAAQRHAPPALGLLDSSDHAQLTVLGRRSPSGSPIGLGLGSVTRAVLHYSDCPVAVVPRVPERSA